MAATVEHVEGLGGLSVLHLRLPGTPSATLLAKSAPDDVAAGETVRVELPSPALHVFDAQGRAQARKPPAG